MNAPQIFTHEAFGRIRAVERGGQPWFIAKDVCDCLELGNTTEALRGLDDDEKFTLSNPEGNPRAGIPLELNIISEPGLYSLILRSRKPEAKAFKRWITHEVIPAIRRTGGYMAAVQSDTPESIMARAVLVAQDTITRLQARTSALEARAEADRPKVVFAESIEVARTSILVGEMAKLIKQATGHDIGQNRFFEWLRDRGYLHKYGCQRNMPTQRSVDSGWMVVKEGTRIGSSGQSCITRTTKITGRGQIYFVNLFAAQSRAA